MKRYLLLLVLLLLAGSALAQDELPAEAELTVPESYLLDQYTYHAQGWNNCGPATLTMALSYFGYSDDQGRAASWLKPNPEDKNVSPWQMVEFVNTQVPEIPVYAMQRYGGTLETLKTLVSNNFPVIIEAGYDPPRAAQGWMGHYLLIIGYNDEREMMITHDSYDGAYMEYTYDHIKTHWQHFNYTYITLFDLEREQELLDLLGDDADEQVNMINAFNIARDEAIENPEDSFAWFNMGSMLVGMELYEDAAVAYDEARSVGDGLPWRMLWYQFGPYEAYNAIGDYNTVLELANAIRTDGGGHWVEETFYYAGLAREGLGETDRAINNYNEALALNTYFHPARERLNSLQTGG